MNGDIGVPIISDFYGSLHLVEGVLGHVDGVVFGRGTAASHQLDFSGPHTQLFPRCGQILVAPISDKGGTELLGTGRLTEKASRSLGGRAKVAMPGRLSNDGPRRPDAGPRRLS